MVRAPLSYVHSASKLKFLPYTVGQVLQRATEKFPDRDLFIFPHQSTRRTYEQFYADARNVASGFLATGMRPGDRIGIWAPNVYEWVLTQYATSLAGLVLVNVNPAYRSRELQYALRKVGCKGLVSSMSFKKNDFMESIFEVCPELASSKAGDLSSRRLPDLKNVYMITDEEQPGCYKFNDLRTAGGSSATEQLDSLSPELDDPVNIQFTSGTTGNPKGVVLSHHNIVNNAYLSAERMLCLQDEPLRLCCPPPLYHCIGCVLASLLTVVRKGTCVFPSPSFEPLPALENVEAEKCTTLYGTPTMFIDMLSHLRFDEFNYSSLQNGMMAGAPCPIEVVKACVSKMHMPNFVTAYGTTENSPVTFMTYPNADLQKRASTVGEVLDHTEAKIVDDQGRIAPIGEKGTLKIRGYCVMSGYYADEEQTKKVISADRWYDTGDTARMDEEGHVAIVGREKDMIIRGGENIYPTEIEQYLYEHPAVEDVHVVGVPDQRMGEEICAWIRLHKGKQVEPQDIKEFLKGKVAHFKIPKYVVFKEEHDFPLTITGKIQKFKIREIARHELGLEHVASHMTD